jgi:hypothetical protein
VQVNYQRRPATDLRFNCDSCGRRQAGSPAGKPLCVETARVRTRRSSWRPPGPGNSPRTSFHYRNGGGAGPAVGARTQNGPIRRPKILALGPTTVRRPHRAGAQRVPCILPPGLTTASISSRAARRPLEPTSYENAKRVSPGADTSMRSRHPALRVPLTLPAGSTDRSDGSKLLGQSCGGSDPATNTSRILTVLRDCSRPPPRRGP